MNTKPLTAQQIVGGYSATDSDTLAEKNREHLRKAIAAGEYITERDSLFFKHCTEKVALTGELLLIGEGARCKIIRAVADEHILIRFTDSRKRHWFAWIHA